jgi:hypothetical protein
LTCNGLFDGPHLNGRESNSREPEVFKF